MLKEFVLSKKTAGYFDPYHPFGCLIVFDAERTVHTLAVYILVNENPREFLLPALIKSTLSMFSPLCGWLQIISTLLSISSLSATPLELVRGVNFPCCLAIARSFTHRLHKATCLITVLHMRKPLGKRGGLPALIYGCGNTDINKIQESH